MRRVAVVPAIHRVLWVILAWQPGVHQWQLAARGVERDMLHNIKT